MSCKTKTCDCEAIECRLDALESNQKELAQRTEELRDAIDELSPYVIAFVADAGLAGDNQDAMMDLINSWVPNALVLGGDNNYPDGDSADADDNLLAFKDYIEEGRCYPVVGNHDEGTDVIPSSSNYLYDKFPDLFSPTRPPRYSIKVPEKDAELFFLYSGMYSDGSLSPYGSNDVGAEIARVTTEINESEYSQRLVFMHHTFCGPDIAGKTHRYLSNLDFIPWVQIGVKTIFSGHTHTAFHLKGTGGDVENLNLVDCSATAEDLNAFTHPISLIGGDTSDFEQTWLYDEETRYVVKILIHKTYYRVEFWTFAGDIHHGFNVQLS